MAGDNTDTGSSRTPATATATLPKPAAPAWSWPRPATSTAATVVPKPQVATARSFGPVGKRRSVLAVIGLSVLTLGVYALVWHHRVNREVGEFDTRMHVVPGRSTLAVTIPWVAGWIISLAGAARIVLAVLNVSLPFDPHFTVVQAYLLLGGIVVIPYIELALPFSAAACLMTLERVRVVEDRLGRTTDVQLRPTRVILWLLAPVLGGLVVIGMIQRRLNRCWLDAPAAAPVVTGRARVS